jgi:NADPH:quinone reductase
MATTMNRQIILAARPAGFPSDSDFRLIETPVPQPGPGEVLIRNLWLSVDPYMRGRMSDAPSYAPPVPVGGVMTGGTVARVEASGDPSLAPGDLVVATGGWQDFALIRAAELRKLDPAPNPLTAALHVLGHIGLTAYFGLLDICDPKPGETVVVSGAAGAVGTVVGQIARLLGCRVIGIAGGAEKVRYLTEELGFDAAFDYKAVSDYRATIAGLCPSGVDVYFDNVGGPITDAILLNLALNARISICGQIALYNAARPEMGPRLLQQLIIKRARMQGFLVLDYMPRFAEALSRLAPWYAAGKIKMRETVTEGLENAPTAFMGMMRGANIGKQLVRIA